MDPREVAGRVRQQYGPAYARGYRESDEQRVLGGGLGHYGERLRALSSAPGTLAALDLGCGTGRYFHCLDGVDDLVGVDVSLDMLRESRDPVSGDRVRIGRISLICANLLEIDFPPDRFDLIYSIGVLGEHSPLTEELLNRMFGWLRGGGRLFFTVVDRDSKPRPRGLARRCVEPILPVLPRRIRGTLQHRWASFYLTELELRGLMKRSRFREFDIGRHAVSGRAWQGAHYDCLAVKSAVGGESEPAVG